ncbi:MAG: bifunctional 4-hydroxy-2-oxoglutarate aldolase/2-dehydro-3-deoxy-phosphogluconate aldolase [Woeseiaceae bacterium]|jgi:2-dehydro-3-deoxyphosphogluconate aldolase/(4S)-4-hydroxy-2-oxoglutarate aldolase|nr:bifunctional 4-hydroxy-2-oxoglutarate aldolase/2-dehydro-3-deoxy-phosphogluconate aldolase [Woeseiaceae bacterium]
MIDAQALLSGVRVVPVVAIDELDTARPLAEAFVEAGIGAIEVTLRTRIALQAIEAIARDVPDLIVGAGSLRTTAQVNDVSRAGARFGVSPGSTTALVASARDAGLPFIPGAATASEMLALLEEGITLQKFFPAELAGGVPYLKAVGAPLPELRFMPTGGLTPLNAADYLALDNVSCIGGSWLAPQGLLRDRDFAAITRLAQDAARLGV